MPSRTTDVIRVLEEVRAGPLLELDHDVLRSRACGWVPHRTTSARLLVSGSWYSTSTSTSVRPASTRSCESTSRLRSQDLISAGRRRPAELVAVLLRQRGHERPVVDLGAQVRAGPAEQRHVSTPGSTKELPARVEACRMTRLSGRSGLLIARLTHVRRYCGTSVSSTAPVARRRLRSAGMPLARRWRGVGGSVAGSASQVRLSRSVERSTLTRGGVALESRDHAASAR